MRYQEKTERGNDDKSYGLVVRDDGGEKVEKAATSVMIETIDSPIGP
ncbi:hypothetical protein [Sulfuriferula sp.]|nr:hypothetical protein [Sulfuriferula sp.]MDP2027589.1 hypothetical protein [Sulfuriferula sp.]